MRLIDADELKEVLSSKDLITWTHEYGDAIPLDWLMSTIDNAPTVNIIQHKDWYLVNIAGAKELLDRERPQGELE